MNVRAEVCSRKAVECRRAALAAPDPNIRRMYLDLAKQWKELSEHAVAIEQHGRSGLIPSAIEEQ
jgi:hypothetical protein